MPLVRWMEAIYIAHPLHLNGRFVETERALYRKTVSLIVAFPSNSFTLLLDGRDQQQTHEFMKMHDGMTYIFHLANIILPMLDIHSALNS